MKIHVTESTGVSLWLPFLALAATCMSGGVITRHTGYPIMQLLIWSRLL